MFSSKEIEKESFLPSGGEQCGNVTAFGRGDQTRVLGSSPTGHFSSDEIRWGQLLGGASFSLGSGFAVLDETQGEVREIRATWQKLDLAAFEGQMNKSSSGEEQRQGTGE